MADVKHTPGPWRWEINEQHRNLSLVGGKPQYDLTIIQPIRWGMSNATLFVRDTAFDGLNLLHKLHERRDWIAPFPGRAHHAKWCAGVAHPDLRLIESAPDLLEAAKLVIAWYEAENDHKGTDFWQRVAMCRESEDALRAAIAKATGAARATEGSAT